MHFTINGQSFEAEPDIRTSLLDLCRALRQRSPIRSAATVRRAATRT